MCDRHLQAGHVRAHHLQGRIESGHLERLAERRAGVGIESPSEQVPEPRPVGQELQRATVGGPSWEVFEEMVVVYRDRNPNARRKVLNV